MKTTLLGCAAVSLMSVAASARISRCRPHRPSFNPSHGRAAMAAFTSAAVRSAETLPIRCNWRRIRFSAPARPWALPQTSINATGFLAGAQIGCDYQFYSHLVLGVEGAVSGSTMKSSTTVAFPAGFPGDQGSVNAKTDFLPSITARLGVALDRVLIYAKGGVAWSGDETNVIGSVMGTPFSFQGSTPAPASPRAAAWTGRFPGRGRSMSNTTITGSATATCS